VISAATTNISKLAMGITMALNIIGILHWSVDPFGFLHNGTPYLLAAILDGIGSPTALAIYVVILFHWIEFYTKAVNLIHKQEMIGKIRTVRYFRRFSQNIGKYLTQ